MDLPQENPFIFWPFIRGPCPSVYNDGAHLVGRLGTCGDHHPRGSPKVPQNRWVFTSLVNPPKTKHRIIWMFCLIFSGLNKCWLFIIIVFSDTYSMRWCSSIQRFWLINRSLCYGTLVVEKLCQMHWTSSPTIFA